MIILILITDSGAEIYKVPNVASCILLAQVYAARWPVFCASLGVAA